VRPRLGIQLNCHGNNLSPATENPGTGFYEDLQMKNQLFAVTRTKRGIAFAAALLAIGASCDFAEAIAANLPSTPFDRQAAIQIGWDTGGFDRRFESRSAGGFDRRFDRRNSDRNYDAGDFDRHFDRSRSDPNFDTGGSDLPPNGR
jgi:hypothetical protein